MDSRHFGADYLDPKIVFRRLRTGAEEMILPMLFSSHCPTFPRAAVPHWDLSCRP